ncbi:unnamed protein product [Ectocarpus sp. 12 AP-2014]
MCGVVALVYVEAARSLVKKFVGVPQLLLLAAAAAGCCCMRFLRITHQQTRRKHQATSSACSQGPFFCARKIEARRLLISTGTRTAAGPIQETENALTTAAGS